MKRKLSSVPAGLKLELVTELGNGWSPHVLKSEIRMGVERGDFLKKSKDDRAGLFLLLTRMESLIITQNVYSENQNFN